MKLSKEAIDDILEDLEENPHDAMEDAAGMDPSSLGGVVIDIGVRPAGGPKDRDDGAMDAEPGAEPGADDELKWLDDFIAKSGKRSG